MISHRLIAGICLALVPMTVAAIPVTYEFSGSVGFFNADLPPDGSIPEPFVPYGTEFTGSFTYENETLPNYQAPGVLQYQNAITGATISFGAGGSLGEFGFANKPYAAYTTQSSFVSFVNDLEFNGNPPYDQFNLTSAIGNAPGDPANMYRNLSFYSSDYSAQAIPAGVPLEAANAARDRATAAKNALDALARQQASQAATVQAQSIAEKAKLTQRGDAYYRPRRTSPTI